MMSTSGLRKETGEHQDNGVILVLNHQISPGIKSLPLVPAQTQINVSIGSCTFILHKTLATVTHSFHHRAQIGLEGKRRTTAAL